MTDHTPMTGTLYRELLAKLNLKPEHAGPLLGISRRSSYRYAQDELPIPAPVAKLLIWIAGERREPATERTIT